MILYDVFLQINEMLSSGCSLPEIIRISGVSRATVKRIRAGDHSFCQPPPIFTNDKLILPCPDHPDIPPLIKKLRHLCEINHPISTEDLVKARQFGLMDDEGTLHLPPLNAPITQASTLNPQASLKLSSSQPSPTVDDYSSPDYIDNLLDEEVREFKEKNSKPTPDPRSPPGYGRCHKCGGWVYLPCWACYIESLCGPIYQKHR